MGVGKMELGSLEVWKVGKLGSLESWEDHQEVKKGMGEGLE